MKISKLFHWLYALVMFLPILFFIPNVFYYAFNEHALNETVTDVDIQYKYNSNVVESRNDLLGGNLYYMDNLVFDQDYLDFSGKIYIFQYSSFDLDFSDFEFDDWYIDDYFDLEDLKFILIFDGDGTYYLQYKSLNTWVSMVDYDALFNMNEAIVMFDTTENIREYYDIYHYWNPDSDIPFYYTDYNVIDYVDVTYDVEQTITQKVYYGWQSVWSLPVFSWTTNTYFSAPFNYISGLFGFQQGNTLSNCLSYWFSISVIWLVFDLMIYVPLLVHRWLDKASLE